MVAKEKVMETAKSLGLTTKDVPGQWAMVSFVGSDGRVVASMGLGAATDWLLGYKAGMAALLGREATPETKEEVCERVRPDAAQVQWTEGRGGCMTAFVGFGVKDAKGREAGAFLSVWSDGTSARFMVQSGRDGAKFGAVQNSAPAGSVESAKEMALAKAQLNAKRVQADARKTGGVYLTAGEKRVRSLAG